MPGPVEYAFAQEVAPDDAVDRLERSLGLRAEQVVAIERTFYDTFDWRVHRRGGVLEAISEGGGSKLTWRALDWTAVHGRVSVPRSEGALATLPAGPFRDRLGDVTGARALLPVASARGRCRSLRLLDGVGKVVLRVLVEHDMCAEAPGRAAVPLAPRVLLAPVRGYERPANRFRRVAAAELGLVPLDDLLLRVLAAVGRSPGDYTARPALELTPEMPIGEAASLALGRFLELFEANIPGIVDDLDTGFLLDARVAIRRARSLLKDVASALPAAAPPTLASELAWLGKVTGPTRDLDVQIRALGAEATIAPDLTPVVDVLETRRRAAHETLVGALRSHRYHALLDHWRAGSDAVSSRTGPTIGAVAHRSIQRSYRRMVRHGRAIRADVSDAALHRLRRRAKELRYSVELYQALLSPRRAAPVGAALRDLQHALGELSDCAEQEARLRLIALDLHDPRALIATGQRVFALMRRQDEVRAEALARISRLSAPSSRERVDQLVSSIAGRHDSS
jgi:CHAD domain-containing protein